jgi:hypothetical protein
VSLQEPWGPVLERLTREVTAALRRRPPAEERLAGALRAVGAWSEQGLALLADAAVTLARRGAFDRPLFLGSLRALVEAGDPRAAEVLRVALAAEDVALGAVGAACFADDKGLAAPLVRAASNRSPQIAFAAELARLRRGESTGGSLAALALRLKEASRIELCSEVFWPLLRVAPLDRVVTPALAVLREAERHLGRWLLLAELAVRAGDEAPRLHAEELARQGPVSARSAWSLAAWALSLAPAPPNLKSPLDALMRLSDRPTNERDLSFFFRLAEAQERQLQGPLEGAAGRLPQGEDDSIRAAFFLIRDHGQEDLRAKLRGVLRVRREGSWGLAAAALYDLQDQGAEELARRCLSARSLTAVAWGGLVLASLASPTSPAAPASPASAVSPASPTSPLFSRGPLLTEPRYRHLHRGLLA